MAGAYGPAAQRAGNALWGDCACARLAYARGRRLAGAAARLSALAHALPGWFRRWLEQGLFDPLFCCARLLAAAAVPWAAGPSRA